MRTQHVLAALATTTLLALTGCGGAEGGSDASDGSGGTARGGSTGAAAVSFRTQERDACEILTPDVARRVLGDLARDQGLDPSGASTEDIAASSCSFSNAGTSLDDLRTISLFVRSARTEAGARSNVDYFDRASRPAGAKDVAGYGDQAFWTPSVGQLNVLADGNWYILTSGLTDPGSHTLAEATRLADALKGAF